MKFNYFLIGALASLFIVPDASAYVKYGSKPAKNTSVTTGGNMYVAGGLLYLPSVTAESDFADTDFDAGYGVRLAVGTSFGNFRIEGELKYTDGAEYDDSYEYDDGYSWVTETTEVVNSQFSIMANGYYDINFADNFGMFVTGGIGMVRDTTTISGTYEDAYDYEEEEVDKSNWVFGYQFGGGLSYKLNTNMNIDLAYRFGGTSEMKVFGSDISISSHELSLGVRYQF